MATLSYAPTKTNLLRLRNDLKFAQQGYELLDQKRNILIIELLALVDQTVDFQNRVEKALAKAPTIPSNNSTQKVMARPVRPRLLRTATLAL